MKKRTTVGELFSNVVRKYPTKTAAIMVDDKSSMTFSEMEDLTNRIANYFDVSLRKLTGEECLKIERIIGRVRNTYLLYVKNTYCTYIHTEIYGWRTDLI